MKQRTQLINRKKNKKEKKHRDGGKGRKTVNTNKLSIPKEEKR